MDIKFTSFIATSLDGYIARLNGKLDWLNDAADKNSTEDYGYQNYIAAIDCIVLGRSSFEKTASFAEWPYQKKRVIVLSRTLKEPPEDFADKVAVFNGSIELLAVELQNQGIQRVYVDGGLTIQSFFKADLMDEITITQIPVLIGRGLPLFGEHSEDIKLTLLQSNSFPSGFVQSKYRVERQSSRYFD
ncbi:dihydrofolate reductase family protein [Aliikangiella coralliicola]|uniref:Dihydrofolate reductase n=1 Tax=Aliikangiella coralliicola TaxID=2592383 RepID=A0A545UE00_9GAMM|nr:dihydrofolate reductase family protein [Aliikangiella coralliicola]TQV87694.1 dihydrofolate reductase [Aliikangiella coralliicola]